MSKQHIAILGAGPAGLMAAWQLAQAGFRVTVLEQDDKVGGMCATLKFQGRAGDYYFDYGGHRFITHNAELLALIDRLMGEDLLHARRKSVIRFRRRIYDYPLNLANLIKTAPFSLLAGAAWDLLQLPFKSKPKDRLGTSFAQWIESHFGRTLYRHFFAGYTQKLWGIKPERLSADWAGQRISLLDLKDVARRLLPGRKDTVRTYARNYRYPKYGFGQIFETLRKELEQLGVEIKQGAEVTGLQARNGRIEQVDYQQNGADQSLAADAVISTLPLPLTCRHLDIPCDLRFRALRFINMPLAQADVSDNTWQYLSDPEQLGTRLQEPKRRSPHMAPEGQTSVMVEIPCNHDDDTWQAQTETLAQQVRSDLAQLDIDPDAFTGECFSASTEHAYPLLELGYQHQREAAFQALSAYDNLIMAGRQGTFRYIFTDTAMEMGLMAADMLIEGEERRRAIFDHRNENIVIETQSVA